MLTAEEIITLLRQDVVPALGCTEPVCVALCAAQAALDLSESVQSITVQVNAGIYKNGKSAGIPHCPHVGLPYAAALGAVLKNPEAGLELLDAVTEETVRQAERLVNQGRVSVSLAEGENRLYVKCVVHTAGGDGVCIIRDAHTHIVYWETQGKVRLNQKDILSSSSSEQPIEVLKQMSIAEIRAAVDALPLADLAFLQDGVTMNETLAAYTETHQAGVGLAAALRQEVGNSRLSRDVLNQIILKVTSAAESRLDGCPLPTMSSSGAGTKGLVVILPIAEMARAISASLERTLRALALGHLINRYINAYVGKLSPMCSCVMASSTAAAAGMTYLLGGTDEQIGFAIRNMTGTVTGMICDGGKVGCALKVATGSTAAVLSAFTAIHDAPLRVTDGICAAAPEDCIRHMARIGNQGMAHTDAEILHIMENPSQI